MQEDIIDNTYRVVCYQHEAACCNDCGKWGQKAGKDEILGSFIGPYLRSWAVWLRNMIGISYRKPPKIIEEMHGITFTPAALIGFETDCYSGYFASVAGAKQKCLAHLARKARDWQSQ